MLSIDRRAKYRAYFCAAYCLTWNPGGSIFKLTSTYLGTLLSNARRWRISCNPARPYEKA